MGSSYSQAVSGTLSSSHALAQQTVKPSICLGLPFSHGVQVKFAATRSDTSTLGAGYFHEIALLPRPGVTPQHMRQVESTNLTNMNTKWWPFRPNGFSGFRALSSFHSWPKQTREAAPRRNVLRLYIFLEMNDLASLYHEGKRGRCAMVRLVQVLCAQRRAASVQLAANISF